MVTTELKATRKPRIDLLSISLNGYGVAASFALAGLAFLLLSADGCSGGFKPYRAMAKAAQSELSPETLAGDRSLKLQLREAILLDETYAGLSISPHVYMERGFVVGSVETVEQANGILRAARTVQGLRSLYGHLPVRKNVPEGNDEESGGSISNLTIKAEVKANLVMVPSIVTSQVDIEVLDGDVVLLGVVHSEKVRDAAQREALNVSGVNEVTNLLLLPESGYTKRRPGIRGILR